MRSLAQIATEKSTSAATTDMATYLHPHAVVATHKWTTIVNNNGGGCDDEGGNDDDHDDDDDGYGECAR